MAFQVHAALATLCLTFVASEATLPGEIYWNSVLPDTTMPRAIFNVLLPGKVDRNSKIVPDLSRRGFHMKHHARFHYTRMHYALSSHNDQVLVKPAISAMVLGETLIGSRKT
uniref:Uncharacterized protein n=1 Tax=Kalanchoe fedtschenkoi TaxID=63787 RepID=A0A7N0TC97_KALFE